MDTLTRRAKTSSKVDVISLKRKDLTGFRGASIIAYNLKEG
jgi:hypothetical protein